jgi:hypothetical protein
MNKIVFLPMLLFYMVSCKNEKKETAMAEHVNEKTERPALASPVKYINWEIGDFNNVKTVVDMYKAWDDGMKDSFHIFFADTLRIRLAEEREEIVVPNNKINEALGKNRDTYISTTNHIISAVSLHDKDSGEDWVMVAAFSNWVEKNGKRDSIAFSDNWRMKQGKIALLSSFTKIPAKQFSVDSMFNRR